MLQHLVKFAKFSIMGEDLSTYAIIEILWKKITIT